jgi:hypothetical protein
MTAKLLRSPDDIVAALRARRDELDIPHEVIDHIAGLQSGYTSKMLAPQPMKGLGAMSLPALLGAMGAALVLVEDSAQLERISRRWQKRRRPPTRRRP